MMSLTFGLFTQVSGSGPLGPLVYFMFDFGLVTFITGCYSLTPKLPEGLHAAKYFLDTKL